MNALIQRVWTAVRTRPSGRDWIEGAIALALASAVYLGVGFATGLLHFAPRPPGEIAMIAAQALIAPALGEELVFRAALVPTTDEAPRALVWIIGSTVFFVAWHLVESELLPGAALLFRRVDFLALAAMLGVICAVLRRRSGSIWTPVALHWAVAVAWLGWFGGPSLTELR